MFHFKNIKETIQLLSRYRFFYIFPYTSKLKYELSDTLIFVIKNYNSSMNSIVKPGNLAIFSTEIPSFFKLMANRIFSSFIPFFIPYFIPFCRSFFIFSFSLTIFSSCILW